MGADPYLDRTRDPANDGVFLGGQRADMRSASTS